MMFVAIVSRTLARQFGMETPEPPEEPNVEEKAADQSVRSIRFLVFLPLAIAGVAGLVGALIFNDPALAAALAVIVCTPVVAFWLISWLFFRSRMEHSGYKW
jgi:hypothetical protein